MSPRVFSLPPNLSFLSLISQVERGLGAAWHLQQIEVLNKSTGERALFRHNDWLQGDKTTVTLVEASSQAARDLVPGKVRSHTVA